MSDPNATAKSPSPFAAAISYAEGGPKAAGYALNNPGDLMTNGQLNSYSSLDEGWAALESQIGEWTSGTSKHAGGDTSLADLGHIYTGNDNPEGWSAAVAQKLGLSPQNTVSDAVRASGQPRVASTASAPVTLPDDDQAIREKVEAYTQQELQRQNSALQAHIAAAAEKDPNITAEAQRLGLQVGVGADIASRNMAVVRKMSLVNEVGAANLPQTAPRLAKLLEDPEFSGVAYDDLNNLSRIDQSAQAMRAGTLTAPTLAQRLYWNYEYPVDRALMKFGPTRAVSDVVGGATEMVGDIGSFLGLHGNGPTRENWLQRQAQGLTPERYGLQRNQGDTVVGTVAPMLPALLATGGIGAAATRVGLSENAAKVLAALGVGAMFTAQQGGETFTRMAAAGKSDAEARHDADVVAGYNAIPNTLMGLTDFVPGLRDYPLLSALGIGGATGAAGQLAQNRVTRQPWQADLRKGALEGAAVQGGMHLGFDFLGQMGETIDTVQASKLRARSPEQFQRFAEAQFEGDPSLRIPAQEFVDYFQKKNIDPAVMAHQVGVTNLDEAAAAGSDLEIPKANFFGKLDPEHQKGLLPHVVDPATDLTAKQAEAGRAELQELVSNGGVERLAQEFQQADAETQASPEWQKAYSELKQRYVDAGEKEPVADTYATKDANAYSYFARNTGQTLDEVMKLHAPKIVAGEAPGMVLHQGPVEGEPGLRIIRHDQAGYDFEADKPQGHYFTLDNGEESPHADVGPIKYEGVASGKNTLTLSPTDVEHVRFGEFRHGTADAGVTALKHLSTPEEFERYRTMSKAALRSELEREFPGSDYSGYHDAYDLLSVLGAQKARAAGFDSLHLSDPDMPQFSEYVSLSKGAHSIQLKPGEPLYQEGSEAAPEGQRGWMRMVPQGPDRLPVVEIGKTKLADFSTFIHEPAHAYLELFRTMSQRADASDQLKSDFATIAKSLGTTPEEIYKNGFTRAQHELWARMNEHYVREGKAPNSQMQRVFQHFSVWLHRIYRQAKSLGVEMSDDIHGVMDRLYAGEQAVDRAARETARQPLFEKPEDAGWTEEEFRRYAESNGVAVEEAKAQVVRELNEAAEREHSQERSEEARNVRDAVTQQIDASPEYTAIRSLRRGTLDDGSALTLNKDALVQQFGEERVNALQKLHRGLYRNEGGTDAETAAELLGFHSGEEMMRALEAAPRRGQAIEAATRDYLVNKYGDVRYDGTLDDRARFAIENKERGANIYRELKALRSKLAVMEKKAADTKSAMAAIATEPLEDYQEAARAMIDQKAPVDLQPYRYLNASRKYSREAFEAAAKGNVRKAAEAKQKELLNHFLFREASEARDYAEKFEKYTQVVQRPTTQQKLGLADVNAKQAGGVGDYRDQHNWLLARYRIWNGRGGDAPRPARSLQEWADDMTAAMKEPAIADRILNEQRAADWRSVPMSELHDVHDALVNIRHLAKMEYEALVDGRRMQIEQMAKDLEEGIRANMKVRPEKVFEKKAGDLRQFLRSVDVQSSRMEFLVNKWDGGKRSFWRKYLWEPYENAKGDEFAMQADFTKAVNDAVEKEAARQGLRLTEKVMVDGIPASEDGLTRKHLVSMALNMGNASNLDRLQKTFDFFNWDREAIQRVGGMLKPEEWRFVQGVWDALKPWGERMKAFEKQQTGLPPVMVEVKPFKVALNDGTEMDLAGGYYPVKYDPRWVSKGYEEDATKSARNLMERGYGRATTSRNYTKERTGSAGPLLLDYERVLSDHIAKVTKDLSHRAFAQTVNQLLLHPRVRQALRETQGAGADQDAMAWLRATVNDRNGSIDGGPNDIRQFLMRRRSNLVKASLAFKGSTSLLQFTHLPRLMTFTNPKSYTQAMVDFWKSPIEMTETIRKLSPNEMRFRGENLSRDYRATLEEVAKKKGLSGSALRFGYAAFRYVDHAVSFPLWLSVYNDALLKNGPEMDEDESHKIAMHAADSAVRMGMGTGTTGDLPPIMRSPDLFKQFETTLWGFENLNYNLIRHKVGGDAARSFRAGAYGTGAAGLTYGLAMTFFLPAIVSAYVRGDGPKDGENWGLWAAKRSLFFGAGTVLLVKDAAALAEYGSDRSLNPMAGIGGKVIDDFRRSGREGNPDTVGFGIDALEGLGDYYGTEGTAELAHLARYVHRAKEGKIANPNAYGALVGGH